MTYRNIIFFYLFKYEEDFFVLLTVFYAFNVAAQDLSDHPNYDGYPTFSDGYWSYTVIDWDNYFVELTECGILENSTLEIPETATNYSTIRAHK